jgi:spore germination cell wall hydrolase CwlJ-like protein
MTNPKDPQLIVWPDPLDPSWQQCLKVSSDCIDGLVKSPVPGADSYYDTSIPPPKWATPGTFVAQIGKIRFYNLDHDVEVL